MPMSPEISLPAELCSDAGSSCKERIAESFVFAKRKLSQELEETKRKAVSADQCGLHDLDSETCSNEKVGTRDSDPTVSAESHLKVPPYLTVSLILKSFVK